MARGFAFDVGAVLGVGKADASPLPEAQEDEIILRIAKGLSLVQLRDSAIGQKLVAQEYWYGDYEWANQPVAPGIYRLRVPVPGSFGKGFAEQHALLSEEESPAPIALVAAALLCLKKAGQPDPYGGKWTRCAESTDGNCYGPETGWNAGLVGARLAWRELTDVYIGLSSVQTS